MSDWRDMIVGDRMAVDEEFSDRIDDSRFSRQEWGLIMTAITFEIENPDDEKRARIVADTSSLPAMMPEIEAISEMGPMGTPQGDSGDGIVDSVFEALGIGGDDGPDEEKIEDAERLVSAYVDAVQTRLEKRGRWQDVRAAAVEG